VGVVVQDQEKFTAVNSPFIPVSETGVDKGEMVVVEMAAPVPAPLSMGEKQELERRRRAAMLNGQGMDMLVETADKERAELVEEEGF